MNNDCYAIYTSPPPTAEPLLEEKPLKGSANLKKKILITILSTSILVGLTLIVLIFGFGFHDNDQNPIYDVVDNLSNYELAENITKQYFDYYKTHGIKMRLSDYRIRRITLCDDAVNDEYIDGKDGFVFAVSFDVKPFFGNLFSDWYAGNGKQENGWCVGKIVYYKIRITDKDQYVMECIGTMY